MTEQGLAARVTPGRNFGFAGVWGPGIWTVFMGWSSKLRQGANSSGWGSNPWLFTLVILVAVLAGLSGCRQAESDPAGTWTVDVTNPSGEVVTFLLEVEREGALYRGALRNGDERTPSTGGEWDGRTLRLRFDYYDGELQAKIDGDQLQGSFSRQWEKKILTRQLVGRRGSRRETAVAAPVPVTLTGDWVLTVGTPPSQRYWRATFQQDERRVGGTLITVSGDWGSFSGTIDGDRIALSRFDGINSRLLKVRWLADGRFEGIVDLGLFDPVRPVVGARLDVDNRELVASLPDPNNHTRMANPAEPLRFAFPSLAGGMVASTDARFRDKVVIVSITGSWCPNCHEESPLLQQYYEEYGDRGLEVVAIAFEYTGDPARDMQQLGVFAGRHRLTFPLLLAGSTAEGEIGSKLPQLVNFSAYPTTIFIGRDGLVRRIHTGFEGRATGERHQRLKAEYRELIEQLLAE